MHHNWIVAERAEQSWCLSLLVRACRYTAGVYSHIPGGLAALPKFDDTDFKIPANVVKGECSVCIWPFVLALHLPCFHQPHKPRRVGHCSRWARIPLACSGTLTVQLTPQQRHRVALRLHV